MKVDTGISSNLHEAGAQAEALEGQGYSGLLCAETAHDPFLPLAAAALTTSKVDLITSIAVAFARTPTVLAHMGHDLNAASGGRFVLGLGSQIKPHITKRFSMPWSAPAARMKEYIQALHAIWDCWYDGVPLEFVGEHYRHTLMTPMFTPTNTEHGRPRVFLAAVGPLMTRVAGEVADGILVHAFTTEAYLRGTTLPALEAGWAAAGKARKDFEITYPGFVVTGATEEAMAEQATLVKKQIGFYGSTPAYRPVLESVGAGDLQPELNAMSKQGRWDAMGELISDELMHQFAIVGEPGEVAGRMLARFGDIVDRTSSAYANLPMAQRATIIEQLNRGVA